MLLFFRNIQPHFTPIVLYRKPLMVPGVGDEAAAADSHGLAVVSISIGATSEGFV